MTVNYNGNQIDAAINRFNYCRCKLLVYAEKNSVVSCYNIDTLTKLIVSSIEQTDDYTIYTFYPDNFGDWNIRSVKDNNIINQIVTIDSIKTFSIDLTDDI